MNVKFTFDDNKSANIKVDSFEIKGFDNVIFDGKVIVLGSTVDSELSYESENAIENKAVAKGKADIIANYASGDVALFPDGAALPVENLIVAITPVQSGSGDPSPSNVRPITGYTGANIIRTGINFAKNIRKGTTVQGGSTKTFTFADDGTFTVTSSGGTSTTTSTISLSSTTNYYSNQSAELYALPDLFVLKAGKTYTVRDCAISVFTGDVDTRTEIGNYLYADAHRNTQITPTSDMHVKQVRIFYRPSIQNDSNFVYEPMVFEGTAADYEPFGEVYSADWTSEAGTVYAGSYEAVSGKLKSRPQYSSYNGETLVGPWLSSMDVYEAGATPTAGAQVVDLGGTETEYTITPQQVVTLVGKNAVWADVGSVFVKYRADTKLYIDNKIAQAISAALNT